MQRLLILAVWSWLALAVPARAFFLDAYVKLDPAAEAAVKRAQKWIAERQRADGSWSHFDTGLGNAGVSAYATLALMVNGSIPGEGPYGKEVSMAVQYLISLQRENGEIAVGNKSDQMYQHALATLVLAECLGMTNNPKIRSALIKAVELIVSVQHNEGGWRYFPRPDPGDISVTVMQVMALRAAAEAGIYVPNDTIQRAIRFIKRCYTPKEKGFGYMGPGGAAFPRTAAGLVCLQSVGLNEDPIIPSVVEYILKNGFSDQKEHWWYGHYYASVGLYHYGGDPYATYYPRIRGKIIEDWQKTGHYASTLDTAWATLVLGVPYRYLPIYQR